MKSILDLTIGGYNNVAISQTRILLRLQNKLHKYRIQGIEGIASSLKIIYV